MPHPFDPQIRVAPCDYCSELYPTSEMYLAYDDHYELCLCQQCYAELGYPETFMDWPHYTEPEGSHAPIQ